MCNLSPQSSDSVSILHEWASGVCCMYHWHSWRWISMWYATTPSIQRADLHVLLLPPSFGNFSWTVFILSLTDFKHGRCSALLGQILDIHPSFSIREALAQHTRRAFKPWLHCTGEAGSHYVRVDCMIIDYIWCCRYSCRLVNLALPTGYNYEDKSVMWLSGDYSYPLINAHCFDHHFIAMQINP